MNTKSGWTADALLGFGSGVRTATAKVGKGLDGGGDSDQAPSR